MNIKAYIYNLNKQIREHTAPADARVKVSYARAYMNGEEGLARYRDRSIAAKINKTYNQDAQLAILFNKETEPEEYAAYQAFRIECKTAVDVEMATLKTELEAALQEG